MTTPLSRSSLANDDLARLKANTYTDDAAGVRMPIRYFCLLTLYIGIGCHLWYANGKRIRRSCGTLARVTGDEHVLASQTRIVGECHSSNSLALTTCEHNVLERVAERSSCEEPFQSTPSYPQATVLNRILFR